MIPLANASFYDSELTWAHVSHNICRDPVHTSTKHSRTPGTVSNSNTNWYINYLLTKTTRERERLRDVSTVLRIWLRDICKTSTKSEAEGTKFTFFPYDIIPLDDASIANMAIIALLLQFEIATEALAFAKT